MATTEVEVVSPDQTLYSGEAEMVVCRTVDGDIAFLAEHTPLIGALEPCPLRIIAEGGDEEVFAIGGGFVDVRNNKVIVLADLARPAGDIDVSEAQSDLSAAEERVQAAGDDGGDRQAAERDQRWAEVRLEVAGEPPSRSGS